MIKSAKNTTKLLNALSVLILRLGIGVVSLSVGMLSFSSSIAADVIGREHLIKETLSQIGLTTGVLDVKPTGVAELFMVTLTTGESFLITSDARYLIHGVVESNPSPIHPISSDVIRHESLGTPVSQEHKAALLANMTSLPLVTSDTVFFHTSVKGLLWAVSQNNIRFLVSDDARYVIGGDISVIKDGKLVGSDTAFEIIKNRHTLTSLEEKTLTIYPAKEERAVVYVATDINCPYCKMFHKRIPTLNAKGITVKVIGYPVYDESPELMRQIWCERDNDQRAKLLSLAMRGIREDGKCQTDDNPLLENITKSRPLGIIATPAIYRQTGELFYGGVQDEALVTFLLSHP